MSILDTFVLLYKANTKSAGKDIDELDEKAKRPGESAKRGAKEGKEALGALGRAFKGVGDDAQQVAKGVASSLGEVAPIAGRLLGVFGSMGSVLGVVTVAAAAMKLGMDAAAKSGERAAALKQDAWAAGVSPEKLTRMQIIGERQHLSNEEMTSSMRGMHGKVQEAWAATHTGRIPNFNDPSFRLASLMQSRGVKVATSGGQIRDYEQIYNAMVGSIRDIANKKGRERAIAVGTQQYGLSLLTVEKALDASNAQLRQLTTGLTSEVVERMKLQRAAEKMNDAHRDMEAQERKMASEVASHTVPAMTSLYGAMNDAQKGGKSLATVIGELASTMISWAAKVLSAYGKYLNEAKVGNDLVTEATRAGALSKNSQWMKEAVAASDKAKSSGRAAGFSEDMIKEFAARAWDKSEDAKKFRGGQEKSRQQTIDMVYRDSRQTVGAAASDEQWDKFRQEASADSAFDFGDKDKILEYMRMQLKAQQSIEKTSDAQARTNAEINAKIPQLSVGLEQAMAMWAGGIGAGAGMSAEKGFESATRSKWEREVRAKQFGMAGSPYSSVPSHNAGSPTPELKPSPYNPIDKISSATSSAHQASYAGLGQIASNAVKSATSIPTQSRQSGNSIHIDASGMQINSAATMTGPAVADIATQLADQLRDTINLFQDPVVS